jgi:hypothetical protein
VDKIFTPPIANKFQFQGHVVISLKKGDGISELKTKVAEIGLQHPKIGMGKFSITQTFTVMQAKIREQKSFTPYLWWQDYLTMAANLGITSFSNLLLISNLFSLPVPFFVF